MHYFKEIKLDKLLAEAKSMTPIRIRGIRALYGLTQVNFADLINISYYTYKNWEIGHRSPCTPGVAILLIAEENPKLFLNKRLNFIKKCTNQDLILQTPQITLSYCK